LDEGEGTKKKQTGGIEKDTELLKGGDPAKGSLNSGWYKVLREKVHSGTQMKKGYKASRETKKRGEGNHRSGTPIRGGQRRNNTNTLLGNLRRVVGVVLVKNYPG